MDDLLNKHHPAPWRVVEPAKWPWFITIRDANGDYVMHLEMPALANTIKEKKIADVLSCKYWPDDESRQRAIEANAVQMEKARRIVAEHNALHAVPLEWLDKYEQAGIEPVLSELAQVKQQRDTLLAIAKRLVEYGLSTSLVSDARAAIASVEGVE